MYGCNRLQKVSERHPAEKNVCRGPPLLEHRGAAPRPERAARLSMMVPAVSNIYEVAKRAGVSTATVSRVLSQPSVVSPDTRRKVMQAVEFLDDEPNSAAKNLRTL